MQDVGSRLPASISEQTIESFTKIEELPKGTGLGLLLVKRHATSLSGSMSIDTEYQDGCRITIEMPK